jgi:hypothetical protein
VVNTTIVKKVTGRRDFFILSFPKLSSFLEGYIQGRITDYDGRPMEGVIVRAVLDGPGDLKKGGQVTEALDSEFKGFDPGITDNAGIYQVRFSLPMVDGEIDMRGRIVYSPGWEQQLTNLGQAYRPQAAETPFRFYFNKRSQTMAFDEGLRTAIVTTTKDASVGKPTTMLPPPIPTGTADNAKPAKSKQDAGSADDMFKSFGFGQ